MYKTIRAAKYLGVDPEDLHNNKPMLWREHAIAYMRVEAEVEEALAKQNKPKRRRH